MPPNALPAPPAKRRKRIPQEHYDTVSTMLIGMVPYSEIQKQLSMRWAKPRKYVMDVMVQVQHDWAANAALLADTRRHQIRAGFEKVLLMAAQQTPPDLHVMTRVMRELGLLDGCYQPAEVNVNHAGAIGVGISLGGLGFKTPDEVRSRIEELRAQLAAQGPKAIQSPPSPAAGVSALAGVPLNNVIDISEANPGDPGDGGGPS